MGACLSCLGLRSSASTNAERARLLYDDPYGAPSHNAYGSWNGNPNSAIAAQNVMSPEEVRREQEALDTITRWANDQIVEIFPYNLTQQQHQQQQQAALAMSSSQQLDGNGSGADGGGPSTNAHHDILLSMIPGDKSKRSIRIYPASRPSSKDAASVRSKTSSARLNGSSPRSKEASGVFVRLNVDLP